MEIEITELTDQNKADIEFLQEQVINKYKTKSALSNAFFYHYERLKVAPIVARLKLVSNFIDTYRNLSN